MPDPAGAPAERCPAPGEPAGRQGERAHRHPTTGASPRRRGRRRDPTVDTRVAEAVIEAYAQLGWAGLSFDEVARRARVGKAALYLRWTSKEDLLLDCMASVRMRHPERPQGDVRADLAQLAHALLAFYASPGGLAFLRLYVESRYVPGLEQRWREREATPRFLETRALVRQAIARGELPEGTSPSLLLDALVGALSNHVLSTPPELFAEMLAHGHAYVESLVDFVLAGAQAVPVPGGPGQAGPAPSSPGQAGPAPVC